MASVTLVSIEWILCIQDSDKAGPIMLAVIPRASTIHIPRPESLVEIIPPINTAIIIKTNLWLVTNIKIVTVYGWQGPYSKFKVSVSSPLFY